MYKLKILSIGKTKSDWLQSGISEYSKRLQGILSIEWIFGKDDSHLLRLLEKESSFYALDPNGRSCSSEEFASWIETEWEKSGSRLAFAIGGAEGLPDLAIQMAKGKISLSKLTFTHQMTRLILLEQIYRSFEINKGSDYHK